MVAFATRAKLGKLGFLMVASELPKRRTNCSFLVGLTVLVSFINRLAEISFNTCEQVKARVEMAKPSNTNDMRGGKISRVKVDSGMVFAKEL